MHSCICKIVARFVKNECDFLINKPSMLKCSTLSQLTRKKEWDEQTNNNDCLQTNYANRI